MSFKKLHNIVYDDKGRRHWKKTQEPLQRPENPKTLPVVDFQKGLQAREQDLNLNHSLGKSVVKSQSDPGFNCSVCSFNCRDSISFMEHLNSRYHNRMEGRQMKVNQITPQAVQEKLKALKVKRPKKSKPTLQDILARLEAPTKEARLS